MASTSILIVATAIISVIAGAGIAYVAIPSIDPSYNANTSITYKSWQDESYIFDNQLTWSLMNQTQVNITLSSSAKLYVQFSAPFLLSLDTTFTTVQYYLVALVIKGVGNTTEPIVFYDSSPATGQYRQISYNPTLTLMTGQLPAGNYNISVQWKSKADAPGTNDLSVSHHNTGDIYHYDRWMMIETIKG